MKPIKKLEGKTVAIVGMGKSWFDYNFSILCYSELFWVIFRK